MYSFPNLESIHCSMSGSNWCFLTCIQISQMAGKLVWYSHRLKNVLQFVLIHMVKVWTITNNAMGIIVHFFQGTAVYASKWKGWTTEDVNVQSQFSKLFYHPVFPNTMCKHSSCFIPFTLLSVVSLFSFSHPTNDYSFSLPTFGGNICDSHL